MNRIICDICGAEYPETLERCPVCNYPRQGTEKLAAAEDASVRTKVKGGRFSSKNVKKRQKAQRKAAQPPEKNPNKPLIITIVLLLIAIVLVSAYIGLRFLRGRDDLPQLLPQKTTAAPTTAPTETTQPPTIPCEELVLNAPVLDLEEKGEQKQLAVMAVPENTTDTMTFVCADPSVAEVTDTGLITAVGSGQTTITITCGAAVKTCTVVCWFQEETTVPVETTLPTVPAASTEPQQPQATEPAVLKLDPDDVSCFTAGETFTLYARLGSSTVGRSKVTWSTSAPKVAVVEKGVVTAIGKGEAVITAEYQGQKAVCTVRCRFETPATEDRQEQEEQSSASWKASHSDVSIAVGESFRLTVRNGSGKTADAIWTMDLDGIVSVDGKTITGRTPGTVTLTTTVDGITLSCIVRVK